MADDKNKYILSIHGMSKSFGRNKVLNHIDLNVKPGSIMGLMGENGAGKSTMMKCLFGTYQKDEGTIVLDGKEVNFSGPKDALENGVAMVHQELNQCLERNVIDNLFLGRYPKNSLGVVDEGRMKKEASDLFRKLGITVNLTQPMKKMSVSKRQMCEIAKAISYNSKVIVLDEPTSSLTAPEVAKLFKMMRQLKDQGIYKTLPDIIRFPPMRFTVIYHSTDRTYFSRRKLLFTRAVLIVPRKQPLTFWF